MSTLESALQRIFLWANECRTSAVNSSKIARRIYNKAADEIPKINPYIPKFQLSWVILEYSTFSGVAMYEYLAVTKNMNMLGTKPIDDMKFRVKLVKKRRILVNRHFSGLKILIATMQKTQVQSVAVKA